MSRVESITAITNYTTPLIRKGYTRDEIERKVFNQFNDQPREFVQNVLDDFLKDNEKFETAQKIIRSKIIYSLVDDKRCIAYDPLDRTRVPFSDRNFKIYFDKEFQNRKRFDISVTCEFQYDPFHPEVLYKGDKGYMIYNQYDPPNWQKEWFYSGGATAIEPHNEIPPLIDKFLKHLVNDDEKSYNYILDWLSFGLQSKNFCFLVTIGRQGIGKGKLGDIMRCLFGERNYYAGGDKMFNGTFNKQIANRRLVYCDEVLLKKKEAQNRLKEVANLIVEIEGKGIDAENIKNYANFYISSNDMDGLPVTEDDRRFSIIELTERKLQEVLTYNEINSLDKDQDALDKFARFLYHRKVDSKKMLYPLKTARRDEIIELTMADWEKLFLYKMIPMYKGQFVEITKLQDDMKELRSGYIPGQTALEKLAVKKPGIFIVRRARKSEQDEHGGRPYGVYILTEEDKAS